MKVAGWNSREWGIDRMFEVFWSSRRRIPTFFFLSETKLDKRLIEKFRTILGMPHLVFKECDGRSGGLALFKKRGIDVSLR
jgi:hypothetical protein